jgi:hypothetical protein
MLDWLWSLPLCLVGQAMCVGWMCLLWSCLLAVNCLWIAVTRIIWPEDAADEVDGVRLSVCRKKNSKRKVEPAEEYYKTMMRKRIETEFLK